MRNEENLKIIDDEISDTNTVLESISIEYKMYSDKLKRLKAERKLYENQS